MKKFLLKGTAYIVALLLFLSFIVFILIKASEMPYTEYFYDYNIEDTVAYHWNLVPVVEQNGNKVTVEYNGNLYSYYATKPITEDKVWIAFVDDTDIIVDANQIIN